MPIQALYPTPYNICSSIAATSNAGERYRPAYRRGHQEAGRGELGQTCWLQSSFLHGHFSSPPSRETMPTF
jgi:hypothetical protein